MTDRLLTSKELSAWDDFRQRVQNMAASAFFLTLPAGLVSRMMSEHEEDCNRMEIAAETIERLNTENQRLSEQLRAELKWRRDNSNE